MWTHGSHVWLLGLTACVRYQKDTGNANSVLLNKIYIERSEMVQNMLLGYPWCVNPCGGGVEYLHREPASRKRRQNGTKKRPRHSLSG
jgi:hypothetical protein